MAQLLGEPIFVARDLNGQPISGAKAYFYLTGTTTDADVYTDGDLITPHEQPVVADSAGRFASIYLDPSVVYRLDLYDDEDVLIEPSPIDPVPNYASLVAPGVSNPVESYVIVVSDETTALTASSSTALLTMRMPYAFVLSSVRCSLTTAQVSGSLVEVDIKLSGTTIFAAKPTFDNTEKTTRTAATPNVLATTAIPDDAELKFYCDQVGSGEAAGLKIMLVGQRSSS